MFRNRPITDYLALTEPVLSVEFFPPKDEKGGEKILRAAAELKSFLRPDFVSITYGAGGSTRERTFRYAKILKEDYEFQVMPHLTCVGAGRGELLRIVEDYQKEGFCNLMALRGDPPQGETRFAPHPDGLRYANDLVKLIRENFSGFSLGVAGYPEVHPEAPSPEEDMANLKRKVEEGASFITTQLFYDNRSYFTFVEQCRKAGINVPVIPGLMPVVSAKALRRFCQNIPAALDLQLHAVGEDPKAIREVGVDWAYLQIRELLAQGAPGIHLYVLNRSRPALALMKRLKEDGLLERQ